eukprot:366281-Chlamydomonas_euryale.AAC.3
MQPSPAISPTPPTESAKCTHMADSFGGRTDKNVSLARAAASSRSRRSSRTTRPRWMSFTA